MSDSEMSDSESDYLPTSGFDTRTKTLVQALYGNRCVLCLCGCLQQSMQCTEILDASEEGASQVAICSHLDIIPRDYQRQSLENGIILCPRCYTLFYYDYIALCPPKEILEYLVKYVKDTPAEKQMPLYQVCTRPTPHPSAILPYVGLYTIVHLKQTKLREITVPTAFSPPLSILHNGQWENAPNQTVPTTPNAAYIFDSLAVKASGQLPSPGAIPLHPDQPYYSHNRYWRLQHTTLSGILWSEFYMTF
ncbi:hypothetical protein BGY98DRAFT_945711 [Russula aff. rugulosa BPL654]|nr:hypothetical protein BGY98DRAFT_945711 [Russula aff. rugulosa BPL654]